MKELNRLDASILNILWTHGPMSCSEISCHIPRPGPAYSTLSLSLRLLCNREIISSEKNGGHCTYIAKLQRNEVVEIALKEVSRRYFADDKSLLIKTLRKILAAPKTGK